MPIEVRPATAADAPYIERSLTEAFAGTMALAHGELIDCLALPAVVAFEAGEPVGLLTYRVSGQGAGSDWEVVSLAAERPGIGVGSALLEWIRATGAGAGAKRIWLVTTNDNVHALRFYQRRGYDLVGLHRDAVTRGRSLKPSIPLELNGIPLRHELELELRL
jgi:ribosomal protein S18 acetylase RimI-like enzyme